MPLLVALLLPLWRCSTSFVIRARAESSAGGQKQSAATLSSRSTRARTLARSQSRRRVQQRASHGQTLIQNKKRWRHPVYSLFSVAPSTAVCQSRGQRKRQKKGCDLYNKSSKSQVLRRQRRAERRMKKKTRPPQHFGHASTEIRF